MSAPMDAETGAPLVGYVDCGGVLVPRAVLARKLPDMSRFERCRADALRADADMRANDGRVPPYFASWARAHVRDVAATMRELAAIARECSDELRGEVRR